MKRIFELISYLSLVMIVLAPVLYYVEKIPLPANKSLMLVATIVWFASACGWMGRPKMNEASDS